MEKNGAYKMDRQYKRCSCVRRVEDRTIKLELVKKRKKKLTGPLAKKELPAEGCSRKNGKREERSQ